VFIHAVFGFLLVAFFLGFAARLRATEAPTS
jgi:hypothetical protein